MCVSTYYKQKPATFVAGSSSLELNTVPGAMIHPDVALAGQNEILAAVRHMKRAVGGQCAFCRSEVPAGRIVLAAEVDLAFESISGLLADLERHPSPRISISPVAVQLTRERHRLAARAQLHRLQAGANSR